MLTKSLRPLRKYDTLPVLWPISGPARLTRRHMNTISEKYSLAPPYLFTLRLGGAENMVLSFIRMVSAVLERLNYLPEKHYMRGPGPACEKKHRH